MSYELSVQFDDEATKTADLSVIETFLAEHGQMRRESPGQWVGQPETGGQFEVELLSGDADHPDSIAVIAIGLPYADLNVAGEPALALAFGLAIHLGWQVRDEQSGVMSAEREVIAEAQQALAESAARTLAARRDREPALDRFAQAARNQSLLFLGRAALAAGLAAAGVVTWLEVPQERLPAWLFGIGVPVGLAIFAVKIGWDSRRRGAAAGAQPPE